MINDLNLTGTAGYYEENNPAIIYTGSWGRSWSSEASGSNLERSSEQGAKAALTFVGTGVKWLGYRANNSGIAEAWVDGKLVEIVNLKNNPTENQQVVFQQTHLGRGQHSLEISVFRGEVNLDRFQVLDTDDLIAPAAPTDLTAEKGNTVVDLNWSASPETDVVGYRVYRSTSETSGFEALSSKALKLLVGTSYRDSGLSNGTPYYYTVTAIDEAGNESVLAPVISVLSAGGAGVHQEDDLGIVYSSGWTRSYNSNTSGSYYMRSTTPDTTAAFIFAGTGIKWLGLPSTEGGTAEVYLDGSFVDTVNLYRLQTEYQTVVWQSGALVAGIHELVIKNMSNKLVNIDYLEVIESSDITPPGVPTGFKVWSEGTYNYLQWEQGPEDDLYGYYIYRSLTGQEDSFSRLNVDPIRYGTTYRVTISDSPVYYQITALDTVGNESPASAIVSSTQVTSPNAHVEEDNLAIEYRGTWTRSANSNASGGNLKSTTDANATFKYTWYGTGIDWLAQKNSNLGIAQVILDNGKPVLVDLYNGSAQNQQPVYRIRELALGMHSLEIKYFGRDIVTSGTGRACSIRLYAHRA